MLAAMRTAAFGSEVMLRHTPGVDERNRGGVRRRAVTAGAVLVAAVLAAPASAQNSGGEGIAANLYVGASLGQGHWRAGCPAGVASCDDTNTALGVFAGYQVNRILAAELGYRNLGKATGGGTSTKAHAWEAIGVAAWPLARSLSVFGKLGIYRSKAEGSGTLLGAKETNYGPTYGLGAQLDLHPNVALRAEWQAYSGIGGSTLPKSDIDVLGVAALWRFR